ncbi:MAG: hypothetical protein KDD37_07480 [Bdellovibrionales bacterium]|nr:hypothetical protein [Bdellovibrionales bacterium]
MTKAKQESPMSALANIAFNIALPVIVLNKLTESLGAFHTLLLALSFPTLFFLYEYYTTRKTNWISILGFLNTLLTGGFALLQLEGKWFALKEAGFPLLIGLFVYFNSFYGKKPFIEQLILNPNMFKVDELEKALVEKQTKTNFHQHLKKTNVYLSYSFFLSAFLNFVLAYNIFTKLDAGLTEVQRSNALNEQISRMTWMGYLVILIPSLICLLFIMQYLAKGIRKYADLDLMDLMHK